MQGISIVIPAYKAEHTIERAVESVLSQKRVHTEIIVIEDGVFDNTQKVLKKYLGQITIISFTKNFGAQFARNKGLASSSYKYVMFLDADDYLEGNFLYGLSEVAIKDGADVVFGNCIKRWNSGREKYFFSSKKFKNETSTDVIIRWLTAKAGPAPCSILWKKNSLKKLGGWNEKYYKNQDGELVLRAMFNNLKLAHSLQGAGIYMQYKGERISHRLDKKAFDSQQMLFDYIKVSAKATQEEEKILDALNYYCVGIINSAQITRDFEVIGKWEKMWNRKFPKLNLIKYHGYKIYVIHFLYYLFGISNVRKIIDFYKKLNSLVYGTSDLA